MEVTKSKRNREPSSERTGNSSKLEIAFGYKLFRLKKNGKITSLFANKQEELVYNKWLKAELHATRNLAPRLGFHALPSKRAPHLSKSGRVWKRVILRNVNVLKRPKSHGGTWYIAQGMKIIE